MAAPLVDLQSFVQSVYLVVKGRYFDDITSDDGVDLVSQMIDWCNMFLDELETTSGPDGQLVDWWFVREAASELGTAVEGEASISIPSTVHHLITDEERYVQVKQDSSVISNWRVVNPKDISSKTDRITEDMCAVVGSSLVFSRAFRDTEATGLVVGDVITKLPRLSRTNVKVLSIVQPQLLLKLGIAKNVTLPDIIQGKLSPNYAQKFNDLLSAAIIRSNASSAAGTATREDYSYVRGI